MGGNKERKKPKSIYIPQGAKEPIHRKNPDGYQHQLIAWHLENMDTSGSWPCSIETLVSIQKRLHEYEKVRWSELSGSSHPLPVDKIIDKAQQRLSDLGYYDYETLYQLEIKNGTQKQRLWGLRVENIFKILWWDPNHEIYPVSKRNT